MLYCLSHSRKLVSNYADKAWPGNNVPIFLKQKENCEDFDALVCNIEEECSFSEMGFFGAQIREHIIKHFAEKRRQLKKGYNYEKVGIQVAL